MDSKTRVMSVLSHKIPDRVPVYPILSGISRKLVDASYKEWSTNSDVYSLSLIKACEKYEQDLIVTLIDLSVECDAWGQEIIYPDNEAAYPNYDNPVIKDIDDYKKIQKVDYKSSKRMMMHIDSIKKIVKGLNGEKNVVAFVFGPLGVLSMLRGQEKMYMDLYDAPDLMKEAVNNITQTLKEYCKALIDAGADAIMLDTLFASGSIMSKPMWTDMEGEASKEIADYVRENGSAFMIHNCGQKIYFDAQIEMMNPDAISFLYPPDDCEDFVQCKEKYGDKVTLVGCIPPALAVTGNEDEWEKSCKEAIDTMGQGGGFILATGCEYPANASFDMAKKMLDVAKTYGKYEED